MSDSRLIDDDAAPTTETTGALVCIECGDQSPVAGRGWRAYPLEGELLIYCPVCASREFDDAG
jgi:hypothetical protein